MDETAIAEFIRGIGSDVLVVVEDDGSFFFRGADQKFPFATLVTSDRYDQFSNLDRPSVFRLNIGVDRETFLGLFTTTAEEDFTTLDRVMPHPVYGSMFWVCVLNPGEATSGTIRPLLEQAYQRAAPKVDGRAGR